MTDKVLNRKFWKQKKKISFEKGREFEVKGHHQST